MGAVTSFEGGVADTPEGQGLDRETLELIVQGIEEEILLLDEDLKILWANESFLNCYDVDLTTLEGSYCYQVTHGLDKRCDSKADPCPVTIVLKTGETKSCLHIHSSKTGKRYVEVRVSPLDLKDGKKGYIHITRDVTQRISAEKEKKDAFKRLEGAYEELQDVDRLKTDIISNVSHELRTPLTISKTALELSLEEEMSETQKGFLEMAVKALDRLNNIVDDLVSVSVIHKGKHKLKITDVDLRILFLSLVDEVNKRFFNKDVLFNLSFPDDIPIIKGDMVDLKKVFRHIIDNSIKFSKGRPEVDLSVNNQKNGVFVSISDKGIGIPEKKLALIFNPLYQIDPSATREFEGTGMGLSVVKSIIGAHKGRVWAESELGKGTTIKVLFPPYLTKE